jgi:EmrB/QacA subfamily drug resistance transporter
MPAGGPLPPAAGRPHAEGRRGAVLLPRAPTDGPPHAPHRPARRMGMAPTSRTHKARLLAVLLMAPFMAQADATIANLAAPSIHADLGASGAELELVIGGYLIAFAMLLITGARLGQTHGYRRVFLVGVSVFTGASLLCGLAPGPIVLIAARVLQGAGAALMNPATLSIIAATFPPRQRGMAIGIWAGVSAMALAIGPLVGGLLTEHISWSWIFFVNVPIGVIAIAASLLLIPESKDESAEQRLDVPGLLTSGIGLFALTYGLIEANTYGWTSGRIVGTFVVAVAMLLAFVLLELRQRIPMLDLSLFRTGTFAGANLAVLLVALAMFGVFFFVSLYMQGVLGYSAVKTGAAFLPMTILIVLVAPIAGKSSDRFGSRWLMTSGMVLIAIQLFYFSRLGVDESYWSLLPAMILGGFGMSLVMTPSAAAAVRALPVDKAGVGSAVLNAFRQVGGSMGIALMGAIMAHRVGGVEGQALFRDKQLFVDGFSTALTFAALIAVLGAVVSFALVRAHDREPTPEGVPEIAA